MSDAKLELVGTGQLRMVAFEERTAVFNPASWETHFLNPAAMAVLARLHESPCGQSDVEALLRALLDDAAGQHAAGHAERILAELRAVGLVRHVR